MNLYLVNIHDTKITGIYGESLHVEATTAERALHKAYGKFLKRYPDGGDMVVHKLELIEENY